MSFPQNMPKPPPKLPPRPGMPSGPIGAPSQAAAPSSGGGLGGLFKKLTAAPAAPQPQAASPSLPHRPSAPAMPGRPAASVPQAGTPRAQMPVGASAGPLTPQGVAPSASAVAAASSRIDLRVLPPNMVPMVEAIIMYDALLVEENGALRECNPKAVEALQPRKQDATKIYNDRLRTLLSDPAGMRGQPPEIREKLMALIRGLEERCAENAMLLKANMDATEKVFGVINNAVLEARRREAMYTNKGGVNWGNNTSVAFNATA